MRRESKRKKGEGEERRNERIKLTRKRWEGKEKRRRKSKRKKKRRGGDL